MSDFLYHPSYLRWYSERTTGAEAGKVYERLLMTGKQKKKCTACDRHMNDDEIRVFEKYVSCSPWLLFFPNSNRMSLIQLKGEINRAAQGQGKHKIEEDISQWTIELERLQGLRPTLVLLNTLELKEIPDVENDIKKAVDTIESTKEKAERVCWSITRWISILIEISVRLPSRSPNWRKNWKTSRRFATMARQSLDSRRKWNGWIAKWRV